MFFSNLFQTNRNKIYNSDIFYSFFKFNFFLFCVFYLTASKSISQVFVKGTLFISSTSSILLNESSFILEPSAVVTNDGTIENKCQNTYLGDASKLLGIGYLNFSKSTVQSIDGNNSSIDCNVSINNSNNLEISSLILGTGSLTSNDFQLSKVLTFTDGDLVTNTNKVIFTSTSSHIGADDSKHINGTCQKIGNTAFTFPVGDGTNLRTTAISAPANETDIFECKYYHESPNSIYNVSLKDPSLVTVSQCEYWILNRVFGFSTASVILSFENVYSCGVTNLSDLRVARWDGTKWEDNGNDISSITGNVSNGTLTSATAISSFSPFTLASTSASNPLPVELIAFDAKCENGNVNLHWSTASEHNNDFFTIQRSLDATNWEDITSSDGAGNSSQLLQYNWLDTESIREPRYYQLKQTDFDGSFKYSEIAYLKNCLATENTLTIIPNPASEFVQFSLNNDEINHFQVFDSQGKLATEQFFDIHTSFYDLAISSFHPGIYVVHVSSNSESYVSKFVKIF
jgi:hypothetical protein